MADDAAGARLGNELRNSRGYVRSRILGLASLSSWMAAPWANEGTRRLHDTAGTIGIGSNGVITLRAASEA